LLLLINLPMTWLLTLQEPWRGGAWRKFPFSNNWTSYKIRSITFGCNQCICRTLSWGKIDCPNMKN
jgi:hypothetical protein